MPDKPDNKDTLEKQTPKSTESLGEKYIKNLKGRLEKMVPPPGSGRVGFNPSSGKANDSMLLDDLQSKHEEPDQKALKQGEEAEEQGTRSKEKQ